MVEKTRLFLIGVCSTVGLFALGPVAGASDGLQPWELWGELPENVSGNTLAANGDFWYAFADSGAVEDRTATYYTLVPTDGTVGPWGRTSDRTLFRAGHSSAVVSESYIYLVAGKGDSALTDTNVVEYASIDADGSLGSWQTTSPISIARTTVGLVVHGDFIYALGGTISLVGFGAGRVVEYAHINVDGTLDPWQRGPDLNDSHPSCAAAAIDGYIYVFAGGVHGYRTMAVERAQINPDGSLRAWEYDTSLPQFRSNLGGAVFGNSIYLAGGAAGTFGRDHLTSVIVSIVQPDHTLGPWEETGGLIQATLNKRLTVVRGHIFATGDGREIEHSMANQPADSDGDGVPDDDDVCPDSDFAETIMIDGCDTEVANMMLGDDGCTMADLIGQCADAAVNNAVFVCCVAHLTNDWKQDGVISGADKGAIQSCVAQADIP